MHDRKQQENNMQQYVVNVSNTPVTFNVHNMGAILLKVNVIYNVLDLQKQRLQKM